MPRHIKKGDQVIINSGNDKGVTAEVMHVFPDKDRVIVKGVNMRTKHLKPTQQNPQGGVLRRESPIHISNVNPVVDGQASRVRFVTKPDGSKVRIAVKGEKELHTLRGPKKQ